MHLDKKKPKKAKKKVVSARARTQASVLISNVRNDYTTGAAAFYLFIYLFLYVEVTSLQSDVYKVETKTRRVPVLQLLTSF